MKHVRLTVVMFVFGVCMAGVLSAQATGEKWMAIKAGRQGGISGLAAMDAGRYLGILDNKNAEDDHVAVLELKSDGTQAVYSAVAWPKESTQPVDIEAVAKVPGAEGLKYLAMESSGRVQEFDLLSDTNTTIKVVKSFQLPGIEGGDNYESIALRKTDGGLIALWANRGGNASPAKLRWARLDLGAGTFSGVNITNVLIEWPNKPDVRQIAEMALDADDNIIISSASDAGDNGPFASVLYKIGKLFVNDQGEPSLNMEAKPVELFRTESYKMEGIVPIPGGFAVTSDDEGKGSSGCIIALEPQPAPPAAPATATPPAQE